MKEKEYLEQYYKEDSIEFKSILNIVAKSKFIILAITVACTVAAFAYAKAKPETYAFKSEFAQVGTLFMPADKIVASEEFKKNLANSEELKGLYTEGTEGAKASDEEIVKWAQSKVTVSSEALNTTINDSGRKVTIAANGKDEKQVVDLVNVYKNTIDLTMTEEKNNYYDEKINSLNRKLEVLKGMNASEDSYSFTLDEISRMKLEKEDVKLLSPINTQNKVEVLSPSVKKYGFMGFAGGLILGLALVFGLDFLKGLR